MTFLSEAKADFVYHIDDLEDFITYTFDEHCGSKELPNVEKFVLEMWKIYLDQVDEILANA